MRYLALACDYDGTVAHHGAVDEETVKALKRVRDSGRRLLLVTGRELTDLQAAFGMLDLFDRIVAENGALVYDPRTREETLLGEAPPERFVSELSADGVAPLSQGKVIVATWSPHEAAVLKKIQELGLELQVIFNKGAVMVLPSGLNKAVGLQAALEQLKLSPHNAVGIGDAENDHAFLDLCECSAAVANALPALKDKVDFVTARDHGRGVEELIESLVGSDLQDRSRRREPARISLGSRVDGGGDLFLPAVDKDLLIAGASGSGKSSLARNILENLVNLKYQVCIIDPEGDYQGLPGVVTIGDSNSEPSFDEVLDLMQRPEQNIAVNLLAILPERRPAVFEEFLERIAPLKKESGRPHRLLLDEAHHLLPSSQSKVADLGLHVGSLILLTVHPDHVNGSALSSIEQVAIIGRSPRQTLGAFATAAGVEMPVEMPEDREDAAWFWTAESGNIVSFRPRLPSEEHKRHKRKYAQGELGDDLCFYFTGPQKNLRLKANNLRTFVQLAEGLDDQTWLYHLDRGDYSRWFRGTIKDDSLAEEAVEIERGERESADVTRAAIRKAIEERYTAPE